MLWSYRNLYIHRFSRQVWGLDRGRRRQVLSCSHRTTDAGKDLVVLWFFHSSLLPPHLSAHPEFPPIPEPRAGNSPPAICRKGSCKAGCQEMSADDIAEGQGGRWVGVNKVISPFPSGSQKHGEKTSVFTHMLHEGKGCKYFGLFLVERSTVFHCL